MNNQNIRTNAVVGKQYNEPACYMLAENSTGSRSSLYLAPILQAKKKKVQGRLSDLFVLEDGSTDSQTNAVNTFCLHRYLVAYCDI